MSTDKKTKEAISEYPKESVLRNGTKLVLRVMVGEDEDDLLNFFRELPLEDRMFLNYDVTDARLLDSWAKKIDYNLVIPLLAIAEGNIVGTATLHRAPFGWQTHVGRMRLVVSRNVRRQSLGRILAREIFFLALALGLDKVMVRIVEEQDAARHVFKALGFEEEAVLKNQVKDLDGNKKNLVIMSQEVPAFWDKIHGLIEDSMSVRSGY